jgi:hypothetical protein
MEFALMLIQQNGQLEKGRRKMMIGIIKVLTARDAGALLSAPESGRNKV